MTWVLVAFIGLVGGVVSGLFGVGGAIVIVPALVLLVKLPTHTASGTSLAALLLPVGLLGAMEYYRRGQVNVPYAIIYDALSAADRPYKAAVAPARALDIMADEVRAGQLDQELFRLFVDGKVFEAKA